MPPKVRDHVITERARILMGTLVLTLRRTKGRTMQDISAEDRQQAIELRARIARAVRDHNDEAAREARRDYILHKAATT
jgi:hypothetical protein